jgi:two-component system, NtrC family, sensor kinase
MAPKPLPSLRTELLANFGVLAAVALLVAVTSVLLFFVAAESEYGAFFLSALIAADVLVFVAFGAYLVRRLVSRPLQDAVQAVEAIAGGDLARRVPEGRTQELAVLSASVNRMTDALLQEQEGRIRVEKLASIGRLAAGIAHEIGNPLGAINGYVHILRRRVGDGNAPPGTAEALDGLEREAARIDRIVRGLLDYARARKVTPTPIDVNDVVRSVVSLLTDQGVLRRVTVDLVLDESRPRLFGERHEIEQVFVNLMLNAVDAMGGAGKLGVLTRRVRVDEIQRAHPRRAGDAPQVAMPRTLSPRVRDWLARADRPDEVAQVIVADSGTGVPEADREKIFDPFYTTKEPGKGTGLGLAIVARIVEHHRGTVWAQKAREGGAAFVMLFPLVDRKAGLPVPDTFRPDEDPHR